MSDHISEILAFTDDLMIAVQIEDAAERTVNTVEIISSPQEMGADGPSEPRGVPLTEPLEGPDAKFLEAIVRRGPGLLLFDLGTSTLPWARWIQVLKSSPATRRIPILAFGPHMEKITLEIAKRHGANVVASRGKFIRSIDQLLLEWLPATDPEKIQEGCRRRTSQLCMEAIELHNHGQFLEAHESFESAFFQAGPTGDHLYRILLQFSAVQLHLEHKNWRGARKMLLRVQGWLRLLPDICRWVNLAQLRRETDQLYAQVVKVTEQPSNPIPDSLIELQPIVLQLPVE